MKSNQNIDEYINELTRLRNNSEFGTLRDSLIKDRIVLGIKDRALKDRAAKQAKKHLEEIDRNKEVDLIKKITDKDRYRSHRNVSSVVEANQRGIVQRETRSLGYLSGTYHIEIGKTVKPVIHSPRIVPFALKNELKRKLESLVKQNVIEKVTEATEWVNSLVAVHKNDQSIRLCIDPTDLNEAIKRQHFQIATLDEILTDTLSRAVTERIISQDEEEFEAQLCFVRKSLPMTDTRFQEFQRITASDSHLMQLLDVIKKGFPEDRKLLPEDLRCYWNYRDELTTHNEPIFKVDRIFVPKKLRQEMLNRIHYSHLGEEKCKNLARQSLFCPGMSNERDIMIEKCAACSTVKRNNMKETVVPHEVSDNVWEKAALDLFILDGSDYLLDFGKFASEYGFTHVTSSPRYAQSNGLVERTIQTVKNTVKKSRLDGTDPYLALLMLRNTPILSEIPSPAQILYSRRPRDILRETALQGLHGAMAKQTPGSKCDTGSKYELSVTALFVSSLSKNENVENYRIFTNVGEAHPFDDIVAEVHFKNSEQKQLYAIQVKSGKDKSAMNKYFDGYDKIMGKGGLKLGESVRNDRIDFWYFCSKSPTRNTMIKDGETIDLKIRTRSTPYNVHEAILGKAVSYELYSNDPKTIDYQSFFNTFYLFLNQPDTPTIIHRLKGMWKINDPRQIISYLDNYFAKNANILDKAAFEHELLKIRLSDYIVTPTKAIAFKHKAVNEWNQLTLDTDVTVVGNEVNVEQYLFGCILQNISDVISVDTWNDIINNEGKLNTDIKKQLRTTPFVMETLKDLVVQKWVDNKLPLILKTDALLPVLKEFSHLKKKYIIIDSNTVNRSVEIESYELRVFRHLGHVAADEMMKSIPVSLQGRKPTSLYEIIKGDGRLSESLTCMEIIRLMIPRQLYLKQECLGGNNYMFFIIETTKPQEDDCEEHRPAGDNIVKYCVPGESYEHWERIRANPRFINYKIFCLSLKDDNKLTLIPKTRDNVQYEEKYRGLEYFFVDQNGESVYNMENDDIIPIIGEVPIHVCWRYIPRCLREGIEIYEEESSSEGVSNEFSVEYNGKLFAEKDFFKESSSKLVIITGAPGIGKSTLLHSLFRFCESKYYILFVDLGRCQPDLRAGKLKSFE
ncbi:hypothetical protein Trydic_g4702, partial [Trypoxylus dichotomus]